MPAVMKEQSKSADVKLLIENGKLVKLLNMIVQNVYKILGTK